jgi:hypothetical protein
MAYADIHYGKHFRSFIQLKSGIETFRQGGPSSPWLKSGRLLNFLAFKT